MTPRKEQRQRENIRYWKELCDHLKSRGSRLRSLEPMKSDYKHYRDFQIGIPGFAVRAGKRREKGQIDAAFIIRGTHASDVFETLEKQKAEIEEECGECLLWYPVESEKRIAFIKTGVDPTNDTDWPNQHEWLANKFEKLIKVFRPRIEKAEDKVSGEQPDLEKVLEKIDEIVRKSADGDYIYRGEQECYDKVSSGLFRESPDLNKADFLVEELQRLILEEAKTYIGQTDGIHKTEDIEVLTELQHFGGKTNLIDFTEDYLIALFFACDGSDQEDGRVILLKRESYASKIRIPPRTIKRVEYQKSIFIESGVVEPELYSVVTIPIDLKRPMLNYLKKYHRISIETIYNDLHGFIRRSAYTEYLTGFKCQREANETENREKKRDLYENAIKHYTEALKLKPDFAAVYKNRAFVYSEIEKFDKAIEDYSKLIDSGYGSPHDTPWLYNNLGLAYAGQGNFTAAIRAYDKAIAINPEYAVAYNNRGITYGTKGDDNSAIQDFNKAIKLTPELTEPYHNLGRTYREKRDLDESISYFSKAIAVNPENARCYNYRGIAYATKRDYDSAIQDFNKAIELNPKYADAYSYRGIAWLNLSEWEKAKADLTKAKDMGLGIIAPFHNRYKTIESFEAELGIKLPKDIAALLRNPWIPPKEQK